MNALASVDAHAGPCRLHGRARTSACPGRRDAARALPLPWRVRALAAGGKRLRPLLCFPERIGSRWGASARGRRRHRARPHGDARPRRSRRRRAHAAGNAGGLVGLRSGYGLVGRRLPVCSVLSRSSPRRPIRGARGGDPRGCVPWRLRAARRCSAARPASPRPADRRLPRALRAGKRGSCSRSPTGSAWAATTTSAPMGSHSGSRSRSPTTSSIAPARRRRPGRFRGPICGKGLRRCRCCSPPSRTRTFGARSPAVARRRLRPSGRHRRTRASSREAALDYAAKARSYIGSAPHRRELEALTFAVVDRAS